MADGKIHGADDQPANAANAANADEAHFVAGTMGAGGKIALLTGASTALAGTSRHRRSVALQATLRVPRPAPETRRRPESSPLVAVKPSLTRAIPSSPRPVDAAIPKDKAQGGAAAAGAIGCLGLLVGVYRMPLNRCRCTKAELRDEGFTRKLRHMHCARCLKRTNKGVLVSFLTSPLYCAGAAAMAAQAAHVAGTPVLRAVRPAWRKVRGIAAGGDGAP